MKRETTSQPRRPTMTRFGQSAVRWFFRLLMTVFYRVRVHGLENYPAEDSLLICANHQSFLDPVVLGVVCPRPVNYLARKTLFRFKPMAWFLTFNDSIPIDRDATGLDGIKETMRRLKRGEAVVMFPEGTRSENGELGEFKSGFCVMARRTKATLVPVGLDGCFQAYARNQKLPRLGVIQVVFGPPIKYEDYADLSDQQATELLQQRVRVCFEKARTRWNAASHQSAGCEDG